MGKDYDGFSEMPVDPEDVKYGDFDRNPKTKRYPGVDKIVEVKFPLTSKEIANIDENAWEELAY